jgi:anti-anti-sigma factor
MAIAMEELTGGVTQVILSGRLDFESAPAVDSQMNALAGSVKAVLVDMQKVTFLGSVGLRALVSPGLAIKTKGGKIVFFGPNEMVGKVLKASGSDSLIPIYHDMESALNALRAN